MQFLILAVIFVIVTVVSLFLMPKGINRVQEPTPLNVPTITVGTTIPVLFGSRLIRDPILVWWGDVKILKVKPPAGAKK